MRTAGEGPKTVRPLRVTAIVPGKIAMPEGYILLDAILAAAVAARDGLPPMEEERVEIEIPLAREPGGRFHLASASRGERSLSRREFTTKRFPEEALYRHGVEARVDTALASTKNLRIPREAFYLKDAALMWWCCGDLAQIEELLGWVHYLGKLRGSGYGIVTRWHVEELGLPSSAGCWSGFPLVRDGKALRPLPLDWVDVTTEEPPRCYSPLTYPYWETGRAVECFAPASVL